MRAARSFRIAAVVLAGLLGSCVAASAQATGTGDGSKTGDGTTPFTGLAQAPEANLFLGSATTRIPIEVPPGRGPMTPQVALDYMSSGGPSPYGHGWDLSLPRLRRTSKLGVLACTDPTVRNELVLTMPGATIECTLQDNGRCRAHVESGFIRIQRNDVDGTELKVTDKSGITYTFGGDGAVTSNWTGPFSANAGKAATGSTTTTAFDPATATAPCRYIASWALRRAEDPNGNYIEYRYIRDGEMLYPHSIAYGAHADGPTTHPYEIRFNWQTRSDDPHDAPGSDVDDVVFNALGGYPATMRYRVRRIDVVYSGAPIRSYEFGYATGRRGRQTFLESVRLLGDHGLALTGGDGQVAATVFLYHDNIDARAGFESVPQTVNRPSLLNPPRSLRVREGSGMRRDVLDLNGDGFPDLIDAAIGVQCKPDSAHPSERFWTVYLGSRSGFSTNPTRWFLPPLTTGDEPACIIQGVINSEDDLNHTRFTTADITGDGIPDYIDGKITSGTGGVKQWTVYPGTPQSPYGAGWGFGAPIAWQFAAGEGDQRDYVRKVAPSISVENLGGFTGNVAVVYQDLLDINGDGLLDLVRTCGTNCEFTTNWEVYLNRGTAGGFQAREYFQGRFPGLTVTSTPPAGTIYTVADVNGDGLPDQLMGAWWDSGWAFEYQVCLNSGHAMDICSQRPVAPRDNGAVIHENFLGPQNTMRDFVDMNGDGLPDIVDRGGWNPPSNQNWRVFLNRGNSFEWAQVAWPAQRGLMREAGESGEVTTWDTFDIDGDGLVDFVDFYNNGAGTYKIHRAVNGAWASNGSGVQPRPTGVRPDLLELTENGVGSRTMLHYRPSTEWVNDGGDGVVDLPFSIWTVTQICRGDAMGFGTCDAPDGGHQVGMNIVYGAGSYDPVEREFRGFARVVTTTIAGSGFPQRGTLTVFHQRSAASGKVQSMATYDATGGGTFDSAPIAATINTWECADLPAGTVSLPDPNDSLSGCPAHPAGNVWIRLKQVDEKSYNGVSTGSPRVATTVTTKWHKCGGTYYGNVEDVSQGDPSGNPRLYVHTEYACNDTAYIVDRPTYVRMRKSNDSTPLAQRWLHYDNQPFGTVATGNVTKVESWLDQGGLGLASGCSQLNSTCVSTAMAYDSRGLLTQTSDPNQQSTTISYDSATGIYPELVIAPLSHKTNTTYDPKCGTLLTQTIVYTGTTAPGPSDQWRNTYDHYCRLETVYRPGEDSSIVTKPYRKYSYLLGAPGMPTVTKTERREPNQTPDGVIRSSVLGDGLGRVIQRKEERVVDGTLKIVATTSAYDSANNLWLQLVPEAVAATTSFETYTPPSAGLGMSIMLHDAAGRLTRVTQADGKFRTIAYGVPWQTTTRDECYNSAGCTGSEVVEKRDALGRVVERTETQEGGAALAATQFEYDELGRLTKTTQGDGATWNGNSAVSTVYDSLGRTIQVTDPDAGTVGPPAVAGVWKYRYDPAGNLRYRDDPKSGQHVQFCYDPLNRITKKKYYRNGDFSSLASCPADITDQITYEYDGAAYGVGRMFRVTDQSGKSTVAEYTALGQTLRSTREMDGVVATTEYRYDAADHTTQMKYPDGEVLAYEYDVAGGLKAVKQISANPIYVQNLTYDVFGRPRAIPHGNGTTDTRTYETTAAKNYRLKQIKAEAGATTYFQYDYKTYDAGGRLTEIDDTTPGSYPAALSADATFTYDGLGRLLTANDVSPGTRVYEYDVWGNIKTKEGIAIAYHAAKPHMPSIATGSLLASLEHDANGNRSKRTATGLAEPELEYDYDLDDRLRLIDADGQGVELAYDYAGRRTKEIRGPVIVDPVSGLKVVQAAGAIVTHHFTDLLEVTHDPIGTPEFVQRKYYRAGELLIASQETTPPATLQVAAAGGAEAVQLAGLFAAGGPVLILRLSPEAAGGAGLALALATSLLLCLPGRRHPAVVGIRVRPADAALLAAALTLGTLPWPLLVRPAQAKGTIPTPTPVPAVQIHHYHLDHLGSPQLVTEGSPAGGSGAVVKQIRYTAYGEVRTYDGDTFSEWDDREFTGYEKEPLSGHSYAGERFYDPDFALFLTHDPAQQFASPYTYTNWNPIGRTDPNGASADLIVGATAASASASAGEVAAASEGAIVPGGGAETVGSSSGGPSPSVGRTALEGPQYSEYYRIDFSHNESGQVVVDQQTGGADWASGAGSDSNALNQGTASGGSTLPPPGESGWVPSGNYYFVMSGDRIPDGMTVAWEIPSSLSLIGVGATLLSKSGLRTADELGTAAREILPKPSVVSEKLRNIISNLYDGATNPKRIGNGTTMDAIKHELQTGQRVHGKFHSIKGRQSMAALENWLKGNPTAAYHDRLVAQSLLDELRSVCGGGGW